MGGEIAVIKKVNDEIESYEGHTNPLSSVPKQLEFYKDPNNIPFTEYLKHSLINFDGDVIPQGYGIFIVDYDGKNIYTINGYSGYLDVYLSEVSMHEQDWDNKGNKKFTSPIHTLFDNGLLKIVERKSIFLDSDAKEYDYINNKGEKMNFENKEYNINEIKDFKDLYEFIDWFEGDKYSRKPKFLRREGKEFEKGDGYSIYRRVFIDYEKLGWNYYSYDESIEGYVELYKQLKKDKFNIDLSLIKRVDAAFEGRYVSGVDYEEMETTFLEMWQSEIRKNKLEELGI